MVTPTHGKWVGAADYKFSDGATRTFLLWNEREEGPHTPNAIILGFTKKDPQKMVVIWQWRPGRGGNVVIEFPGGHYGPGHEDAVSAALFHLKRETGYATAPENLIELPSLLVDPASNSAQTVSFLGLELEKVADPEFGENELIEVELFTTDEILDKMATVPSANNGSMMGALLLALHHLNKIKS